MHHIPIEQTRPWAQFRKSATGESFYEITFGENERAIVSVMPLPYGLSWLYCNRGPLVNNLSEKIMREFIDVLDAPAKKHNAVFVRIEPPYIFQSKEEQSYNKLMRTLHFRPAHASHQPAYTRVIDLTQSEGDILAQMKQKGRYNIRLAKKKGVSVKQETDVTPFYHMLRETTKRDGFSPHKKKFYQAMIDILGKKDMAALYTATYKNIVIAGLLATFHDKKATYYYGASSNTHRNVMAPYLLQWHAMQEAKKRGCTTYDLLGIAPPNTPNHPLNGVSSFKKKFGGDVVHYTQAREYVYKPFWYNAMRLLKKIKGH